MFWLEKSGVTPARSDTVAAVPAPGQESLCSCPVSWAHPWPQARNIRGLLSPCHSLSIDVNQDTETDSIHPEYCISQLIFSVNKINLSQVTRAEQ